MAGEIPPVGAVGEGDAVGLDEGVEVLLTVGLGGIWVDVGEGVWDGRGVAVAVVVAVTVSPPDGASVALDVGVPVR